MHEANDLFSDDAWIVIYRADDLHQAQLVCNLLEEHEIEAHVLHDRQVDLGHILSSMADAHGLERHRHSSPRVVVRQSDGEAAYELVAAAEHNLVEGRSSADLEKLEDEADRDFCEWPACPDCRRPRLAVCPICQTSGTSFVAAFHPDVDVDQRSRSLVLCPTCDEAFAPKFPARCEWCGHHFPDGWEPAPMETTEPIDVNGRVIAAFVGVVLTLVGLVALFARIASQ